MERHTQKTGSTNNDWLVKSGKREEIGLWDNSLIQATYTEHASSGGHCSQHSEYVRARP